MHAAKCHCIADLPHGQRRCMQVPLRSNTCAGWQPPPGCTASVCTVHLVSVRNCLAGLRHAGTVPAEPGVPDGACMSRQVDARHMHVQGSNDLGGCLSSAVLTSHAGCVQDKDSVGRLQLCPCHVSLLSLLAQMHLLVVLDALVALPSSAFVYVHSQLHLLLVVSRRGLAERLPVSVVGPTTACMETRNAQVLYLLEATRSA
jgi:hypothetical protein